MEAQALLIVLHDDSAGYEITPDRVPLAALRRFAKDVDEFLRGDGNDVDTAGLDVAVVKGSLGLRTAPTANPALLGDLRRLAAGGLLEGVAGKRRAVVERWQKAARGAQRLRVQISSDFLPAPIKLVAQAVCESLTHILTEDAQTLVKYVRRLSDAGQCTLQTILLADGFDAAWFNNGQRGLPCT